MSESHIWIRVLTHILLYLVILSFGRSICSPAPHTQYSWVPWLFWKTKKVPAISWKADTSPLQLFSLWHFCWGIGSVTGSWYGEGHSLTPAGVLAGLLLAPKDSHQGPRPPFPTAPAGLWPLGNLGWWPVLPYLFVPLWEQKCQADLDIGSFCPETQPCPELPSASQASGGSRELGMQGTGACIWEPCIGSIKKSS